MFCIFCLFVTAHLLLLSKSTTCGVSSPHDNRLKCLQYINELGRKDINLKYKQWIRSSNVRHNVTLLNQSQQEDGHWVFNAPRCPLQDFNSQKFCINAIGCGKKILLVGDSTLKAWMSQLPVLLGDDDVVKQNVTACPPRYVPDCVRTIKSSPTGRHSRCDPTTHWGADAFIYGKIRK